jgi:hypothetical protein
MAGFSASKRIQTERTPPIDETFARMPILTLALRFRSQALAIPRRLAHRSKAGGSVKGSGRAVDHSDRRAITGWRRSRDPRGIPGNGRMLVIGVVSIFVVAKSALSSHPRRSSGAGGGCEVNSFTFSPDERLFQVECAAKSVEKEPFSVGIRCSDGVLPADRLRGLRIQTELPSGGLRIRMSDIQQQNRRNRRLCDSQKQRLHKNPLNTGPRL